MTTASKWAVEIPRSLDQLHEELQGIKKEKGPNAHILQLLDSIRSLSAAALLLDFSEASKQKVEDWLWDAHLKINTAFRTALRQLNEGGNAKVVERRKFSSEYLRFIKSSQKFFRGYIRSLSITFGGIPTLQKLAIKFNHDDLLLPRGQLGTALAPTRDQILRSCFRTLIQLGDLSRYREAELAKGDPDWSHAVGFYDLARFIFPDSGISYNQMAIVALSDNGPLRAIYWLFRAMSTKEPHPQADSNLRRALGKVMQIHQGEKPKKAPSNVGINHMEVVARVCLKKPCTESESLNDSMINELRVALREERQTTTMRKQFLINFAATQYLQTNFTKTKGADDSFRQFVLMLKITLSFLCELLQVVKERFSMHAKGGLDAAERISLDGSLRNTLPLLRLSLLWSMKNTVILRNQIHPEVDELQSTVWASFMDTASCITQAVSIHDLPHLTYMLEEDEDTIGFLPLVCEETRFIWLDKSAKSRLIWHDVEERADENTEMLFRFRQCLEMFAEFAKDKQNPIASDPRSSALSYCLQSSQTQPLEPLQATDNIAKTADSCDIEEEAERMVSDLLEELEEANLESNLTTLPGPELVSLKPETGPDGIQTDGKSRQTIGEKVHETVDEPQSPRTYIRGMTASPHTPHLRSSHIPMVRTVSNHSRAISNSSMGSLSPGASWSTPHYNSVPRSHPTNQHRSSLGQEFLTSDGSPHDSTKDYGMGSSMLFGAGQSPWSMSQPETKRLSEAHERTNSSPRLMPKPLSSPIRRQSYGPGSSAWDDISSDGLASTRIESPSTPSSRWNVHAKPFK